MGTAVQILDTLEHLGVMAISHQSSNTKALDINFKPSSNSLSVRGRATEENHYNEYIQLIDELKDHLEYHPLHAQLSYDLFNSATAMFIFSLIKILNHAHQTGKSVDIEWIVNNHSKEMVETGIDFQSFCEFPFDIKFK